MNQTNQNHLVRTSQIEWQPLAEEGVSGVSIKSLLFDSEANRAPTIMLKFAAGATYPLHNHPAGEEIFVIEGDVKIGKDEMQAGDYLFTAANNKHRVSTRDGCVLLLVVPQAVEIIKPRRKTKDAG